MNILSRFIVLSILSVMSVCPVVGQVVYPLWETTPPTDNGLTGPETTDNCPGNISEASLTVLRPTGANSNGAAVLVIPGGAYWVVCDDHEGRAVADWLVDLGYTVGVLKYRLPNGHLDVPLQDAQQALRFMRGQAEFWELDASRIGVLGFSAGGHLASSVGTHFESDYSHGKGDLLDVSNRPDFMVLVYPVITLSKEYGHAFSRTNLLGENPDRSTIERYSNHLHVDENTPPTILIHSNDDTAVHPFNSVKFYTSLVTSSVPAEMHIFNSGGHGYGLDPNSGSSEWTQLVANWMSILIN